MSQVSESVTTSSTTPPENHPPRLNLGCGFDKREGYLNVDLQDFHDPDLVADIRRLDMLDTGRYEEIIAQDILEHLERDDVPPTLAEWGRLLAPGGRLILRVPDLIGLAKVMARKPTVQEHEILIRNLYGTQAYTGDYHQSGFTELTLRAQLHDAGFLVRELVAKDEWMFDVVAERVEDVGEFDPGPLPFLRMCDHNDDVEFDVYAQRELGTVDRLISTVGRRLPDAVAEPARDAWRSARRKLADRDLI